MKKSFPLVSFIIPVYNDQENLRQCLSHIYSQSTSVSSEVIVLDDCSQDKSISVAESFGAKIVRESQNHGQSYLRNKGARLARGKYLFFVDSDVCLLPNSLEKAVQLMLMQTNQDPNFGGIQGGFSLKHPSARWSTLLYNTLQHFLFFSPRYSSGVNTACLCILRKVFFELGGFDPNLRFLEDTQFGMKAGTANYYFIRGEIEFVHLKETSWKQLLQAYILSGKILGYLYRKRLFQKKKTTKGGSGRKGRTNRYLLKNLICSFCVCLSAPFWIFNPPIAKGLIILVVLMMMRTVFALWTVKRNIFFVLIGFLFYLIIPLCIIFGIITSNENSPFVSTIPAGIHAKC